MKTALNKSFEPKITQTLSFSPLSSKLFLKASFKD
jgi:hypothetical protein